MRGRMAAGQSERSARLGRGATGVKEARARASAAGVLDAVARSACGELPPNRPPNATATTEIRTNAGAIRTTRGARPRAPRRPLAANPSGDVDEDVLRL